MNMSKNETAAHVPEAKVRALLQQYACPAAYHQVRAQFLGAIALRPARVAPGACGYRQPLPLRRAAAAGELSFVKRRSVGHGDLFAGLDAAHRMKLDAARAHTAARSARRSGWCSASHRRT